MNQPVVRRYPHNPILTPQDIPYPVHTVHNAGVVKHEDRYIMLFRAHRDNGRSILGLAESEDGYHFRARPKPFLEPARPGQFPTSGEAPRQAEPGGPPADAEPGGPPPGFGPGAAGSRSEPGGAPPGWQPAEALPATARRTSPGSLNDLFAEYEAYGLEDPRICKLDDEYLITYSAYSRHGVRIGLARTRDWVSVERIALITQADTRNVVLFPRRFADPRGGPPRYARLDRPHSEISRWSIWVSYSPDLIHWGDSVRVIQPVEYHWDALKIGPGAPPICTPRGWLSIYHGVFPTMDGSIYRLGVALHDLDDPARVIGVSDRWILQPEDPWEVTGYVHNVVFTCGAVPEDDGTVKIYWGAADRVMCVGTACLEELVDLCLRHSRPAL